MKKLISLLLSFLLIGVAFAANNGKRPDRAEEFRKLINAPVFGNEASEKRQPAGLTFSFSDLSFLSEYTVTNQIINPVFRKGIVKRVYLRNRKNKNCSLVIQFFVGTNGCKDMNDLLFESIVNSSLPVDVLAKRFKPIESEYGDIFLSSENTDGSINNTFALTRGNVGVLVSLYGDNTFDLSSWVREIGILLSRPAGKKVDVKPDSSYSFPEKIASKGVVLSKSLRKKKSESVTYAIDAVSDNDKLVIHKLPDETFEVTATGKKGKVSVGLVFYDTSTLNSTWEVFPVTVEEKK